MKINFDQTLKNFDGTGAVHQAKPLTLSLVCALSLNGAKPTDATQALERGRLAMTIFPGGEHDLTPEQCSMCRAVLHEMWSPAIVA